MRHKKSMRRIRRKVRRTRRQRGGDRTPENLQGFIEKYLPYTVEMTDLTGKTIIVKNKDGKYLFLGSMTFPDGDLKVLIDNDDIRGKIEAWLTKTVPKLE